MTIVKERGIPAEDVAIPVDTLPGSVARLSEMKWEVRGWLR